MLLTHKTHRKHKLNLRRIIVGYLAVLCLIISQNTYGQVPTIDGHFCDAAIWGAATGLDGCGDARPPTADMGNLYTVVDGDFLYIGWQRCTNGSGTSTYTIRFDTDCDGVEDAYIFVEWSSIGSSCSKPEDVYISDGTTNLYLTQAMQGSYICNSGTPDCSEAGKFMEWVLDMNAVIEALVTLGNIDPCACACENIDLIDAITLSGGSLTSSATDDFDAFSFSHEFEINDCPVSAIFSQNQSCVSEIVSFDGTESYDISPNEDSLHYLWRFDDGTFSTDSMPDHIYSSTGTYDVELVVYDKFNCRDSVTHRITIFPELLASCNQIDSVSCFGLTDGSAIINPIGGDGNYSYTWDNGETTQTAISLSAGIHSVTLEDAAGCSEICEVRILEPDVLECNTTLIQNASCFSFDDGSATANPTGGNGGFSYIWDNGETTQTAISLYAGTHSVTVSDYKSCQYICDIIITEPAELSCTALQDNPVLCFGEATGQATVSPEGQDGPYTYLWDNGETTQTAMALNVGTHSITVTDNIGCTTDCSVLIEEPTLLECSAIEVDPVSCTDGTDGTAEVTPSGGNGGYNYLWDNGETTAIATALIAGTHTVTVTDSKACTSVCLVEITQPDSKIECTVSQDEPVICKGEANGEATVRVRGGNGGGNISWDNGETTRTAVALTAGYHTVTVEDRKGCQSQCVVLIEEPEFDVSCTAIEINPVECNGESNGEATVSPEGGNGGFIILWDNNETTANATNLNAGIHTVTVTDSEGCSSTCSVTINEPDAVISCSAVEDSPVVCNGESNGQATVTANGGNGDYIYLWDNNETTATATTLDVGLHTVTVTDSKGCSTECSVTINEPSAALSCTASEDICVQCFGGSDAQATVTPQGGNGGYTYLWDNGETTNTAVMLDEGLHSVTVTDSKDCTTTCSVTITGPSEPLGCTVVEDKPVDCFGESNGVATATPAGGYSFNPYITGPEYTFLWDNNETTATATALTAGMHNVTLTDAKGCETTCSIFINEPTDQVTCTVVEDSPAACNGESNGIATVTPLGGNGGFTFIWDNNETTQTAIALNVGLHSVTVTDSEGCSSSCNVTINQPSEQVSCTVVEDSPVDCNGENNGIATVSPTGGNGSFTILWDNNETTLTATALSAGSHTVTVTDNKGCSSSCSVIINGPAAVSCRIVEDSPVVCFGESNGVATVTPSGGNGGYTFLWDNNETTGTVTNLNAGIHSVTVTDSKGCTSSCSITINEPAAQVSCTIVEDSSVACTGESNGVATVSPTGGNGSFTFLWDNNETTQTATALNVGSHTVTVTDSKGCSSTCSVIINEPSDQVTCTVVEDNPIDCNGGSNGQATVTPLGGNGGFTFLWDNNETTQTALALNVGLHSVTVTDSRGCSSTCTVTINEPTDQVTCTVVEDIPVECSGGSNGQATVSPTGGNGGFSILWDNNETTLTATALTGGTHTVTVTDSKGCSSTCSVLINQPNSSVSCTTVEDSPVVCFGEVNGIATVSPTGGNGGFTVLWDNNETTLTATALNAGAHTVTVTDSKDCSSICLVIIEEPTAELTCTIIEDNPVVCFGESNGQSTVTPNGGNGGYTYLWDNGETTATATALDAGLHSVVVTDFKGCTTSCSVTINSPTAELNCSAIEDEPVNCNGESNGQATVTPSGGNGGYTYLWDNGETTATATALNAGTHTVVVTDSKDCTTSCTVIINEPNEILTCSTTEDNPVACRGEATGEATVTPSGGNGGYTYLWDNGETTATAIALNAGSHTVIVTDSRDCTTSCTVTINEPAEDLSCTAVEESSVACNGEANGQATVTASGGNGAYTYLWDNDETTATATMLGAGLHTVTVTDSKDCETVCVVEINQPDARISCETRQVSPVLCFGDSNGSASVNVFGGNGSNIFEWDNGETTSAAISLNAGFHSVTVTDIRGCESQCIVFIDTPDELLCSIVEDKPVDCFGDSNGEATVTVTGGTTRYSYEWDNGETTATVTNLDAGLHSVTITDFNDCTTTCSVLINGPVEAISCSATEDDPVVCRGESNGQATVTTSGGNGGYTYLWDNGETTATATALDAGTHTVVVTDSKDCTSSCTVIINEPSEELTCAITEDNPVVCKGESNGQATVTPNGGNGGYTYLWDNGESTATATILDAGLHTVTVTDSKDCTSMCTVTINEPDADLTCSASEDNPVVCKGESNGQATVTPDGGNGGYTYLWDNGEITATAIYLSAGLHTVVVTDSKDCITTCTVTINEPVAILTCSVAEDNPVVCKGESNGQATVTPDGGNGGYTYLWDNGETTATATALDAGDHTVTITDSKNCTTICTVTITEPAEVLTCSASEDSPVVCKGESNGQATVTPIGGNGGNTYIWDNGETTATAIALNAGTHTVTVTDSKNCTTTCSVIITEPAEPISCTVVRDKYIECNCQDNGHATVTAIGGNGNYSYLWSNGETTQQAVSLGEGSHTVTVTDSKNCQSTCTINMEIDPGCCFNIRSNGFLRNTVQGN